MAGRRVAIVTDWYPSPERPLLGTFVAEQARAVARRHDVAVVVTPAVGSPLGPPWQVTEEERLGLRTLRVRHRATRLPKLGFLLRLAGTAAALRRIRPELLHAHVYGPGAVAVALGRAARLPVVVSEHSSGIALDAVGGTDRLVARLAYRYADVVCPASEDLAARLERYRPRRVRVVPNPVDPDVFHPGPPRKDGPFRALYVGALQDTKGIPELLEAVAALPDREGFRIELVGDGPGRAAYERRALELGLGDSVRFAGPLPHDEVAAAMREASFLVHPSHWENLPNVLIEALACGLPVVATDVGGVREIVRPGEGILVPPRDATALADALGRMREGFRDYDPKRLGASALHRFGFDVVAERWTEVYEDVLAARGRAG